MSDNWISLVPEDPRFVPELARQHRAYDRFAEIAPDAEEIEVLVSEGIKFFDCGANLTRIVCPSCEAEISMEWWHDRMEEDSNNGHGEGGFKLAMYRTLCCGTTHTLNELTYEWPQRFGRFAIDAMNPNIGAIDVKLKEEFEAILGVKLHVIYQYI